MKSTTQSAHRGLAASRLRFGEANPTQGSHAKLTTAKQSHRHDAGPQIEPAILAKQFRPKIPKESTIPFHRDAARAAPGRL